MEFGGAPNDHAAEIEIGIHLLTLPRSRNHIRVGVRRIVQMIEPAGQLFVMSRRPGSDKPSGLLPIAVDVFVGDQVLNGRESVGGRSKDALHLPCGSIEPASREAFT